MLRCLTKCYDEKGGLLKIYKDQPERKKAELAHVERLAGLYPALLCVNEVRAAAQAHGGDQRSLPVHFVNAGDPPLEGEKAPWRYPVNDVNVSVVGVVSERVESLAGKRCNIR